MAESAIRVLEVEAEMAEMNETQAKRCAELPSLVNAPEHKLKLKALSAEAVEKAVAIRARIRQMRNHVRN